MAAGENPFEQDSLESVWNGLRMFLERQCSENTFGSVNLWNPKSMGTPATDEPSPPVP